jgi:drug/metabolite transporter (DMT)-like permease
VIGDKKLFYLMLFAMTLWGAGWVALKILTPHASFEVITFWRFLIMFVSFIPIAFLMRPKLNIPIKSWKYIVVAATLNLGFMVFSFFGIKYGTASGGAVIITTITPLLTFVLMRIFKKDSINQYQILGIVLGLIGGLIMLEIGFVSFERFFDKGNLFYIFAALIWALITMLSQASHKHLHPVHYSFAISLIGTIIVFFGTLHVDLSVVFDQDMRFWAALIFLGVFGQTVATTIYYVASGKLGSSQASSFMFIVPLTALILAFFILGEALEVHILVGGLISLFAVYLMNKKSSGSLEVKWPLRTFLWALAGIKKK